MRNAAIYESVVGVRKGGKEGGNAHPGLPFTEPFTEYMALSFSCLRSGQQPPQRACRDAQFPEPLHRVKNFFLLPQQGNRLLARSNLVSKSVVVHVKS
jgi:hypothetical protein